MYFNCFLGQNILQNPRDTETEALLRVSATVLALVQHAGRSKFNGWTVRVGTARCSGDPLEGPQDGYMHDRGAGDGSTPFSNPGIPWGIPWAG